MEYLTLIASDENTIAETEREFLNLHREIMYCGNMAATYVVEMAKKLKQMRDGKLYVAAEFETFGDYVENAVGIKERQAYNYINVLENLPESFLQSNAKLGITKLALLAPLSDEKRAEVMQSTDIESATVKELQAEIEKHKQKIEQMQLDFEDEKAALIAEREKAESGEDGKAKDLANAQAEVKRLEKIAEEHQADAKRYSDLTLEKSKLEKQIKDLLDAPKEVATIDNPKTAAELAAAKEKADNLTSEIETLKKQLKIASDSTIAIFNIRFNELQTLGGELLALIDKVDEQTKSKLRAAIKTVVGGWNL